MYVSELMSTSAISVREDDSAEYAARLMQRYEIGSLPVTCGQILCGMLTERDIIVGCVAEGRNPARCRVGEIMSGDACCIAPRESISKAIRLMGEHRLRRLPVVEDRLIRGTLSIGDIARATRDMEYTRAIGEIGLCD